MLTTFRRRLVAIITSWWFLGLLGWSLIISNYPIDAILPRYAG